MLLRKVVGIGSAFLLVILELFPAQTWAAVSHVDDLEKLIGKEITSLARTPPVYVEADSVSTLSDEFVALNPQIDAKKHKVVYEHYTGWFDGDRYVVSSSTGYSPGVFDATKTTIAYNGKQTFTKASDGQVISVKNTRTSFPDNSLPLGTVLFAPYSFIFPQSAASNELNKLALLSSGSLNLEKFAENLKDLDVTIDQDGDALILAKYVSGASCKITVDLDSFYQIKSWVAYNAEGNKTLSLTVEEAGMVNLDGKPYKYPKRFTLERYINGFGFGKRRVEIKLLRLMSENERKEDKMEIDLSSASVIVDEDSGVQIPVPR